MYASKLLLYVLSTLAKCYRMRGIRLQFATVCAVYASKLLTHAPHTLAKCYRMRLHKHHFYTILLVYVAHAVEIC
jgi:hypothetical protein